MRGSGDIPPPFLTLALDGGEWSVSRPDRFIPEEITPDTHWPGGWLGTRDGVDTVEYKKISCPCRILNLGRPARIPTEISRFNSLYCNLFNQTYYIYFPRFVTHACLGRLMWDLWWTI
jgi:hypothetical protein